MSVQNERQSNYELLRLIAMLGVVVLHAIHAIRGSGAVISNAATYIDAVSHTAVPLFVILSGYFSIRPKWKSFSSFIFQSLFFSVGISAVAMLMGVGRLQFNDFFLTWYWFTIAYIGLYIIAPVLNTFTENISGSVFLNVLCAFLLYEVLYGWLCSSAAGFNEGISLITIVGYYLIGRFLKLNRPYWENWNGWINLLTALGVLGICTILYISMRDRIPERMVFLSYTNPMVMIASVFLFMAFSKLTFHSRVVNYLSKSCYAVYLLALHRILLYSCFSDSIINAYGSFLKVAVIIALFYLSAILLDQVRIVCWKLLVVAWSNIKRIPLCLNCRR